MNTLALNTHTFVKRLKAANMTEEQAEVIVDGINAARDSDLQNLATKADLAALKADLKEVESSLHAKIDKVELRLSGDISLLKWMIGVVIAGILAIVLKTYFPH